MEQRRGGQRQHRDFAGILSHVDTEAIAALSLSIMQRHLAEDKKRKPSPLQLPLVRGQFFGSAHVFYMIEFYHPQTRKAIKWIIKIPINGTPDIWDRLCAETLRTEALVLYSM
ncbi:uncharacterized protein F4822DRAFT_122452 [Hypoxylon trugodes]|uniref:uncharacterized protein n=1 Tax=Hypoxylon trugodes TaxID=326681 RepID=UPI0021A0BBCB|nr:uncharacterized protein F4822DRAFT_122452 [Hypoxylon trugodes]KAI1392258.1 hypothetical protein F4822DRAFT_122452 [Hypoxylon trugodes]